MRTHLRKLFWALAVALTVGFATTPSVEASEASGTRTEATPRRETLWGLPRDDPAIAVGAIVGGIAILVLFAWIASHVGDES